MTKKIKNHSQSRPHEQPARRLRIGLTGGIASGKTTVSNQLAELGAGIIDTDLIAREVVAPGTPGLTAVIADFGDELLRDDGALDRSALRARVFANPDEKSRLEAMLHPLIRAAALDRVESTPGDYLVFVVPLLIETDFAELVDRILVVDCPPELQQQRLMQRDNESRGASARLIAGQIERDRRLARADDVIVNDGSLARLRKAVEALHHRYLRLARSLAADQN